MKLHEETLALKRSKLGPDHPNTLSSMNNLAASYDAAGQTDRAMKLYEETLALQKAKLGPDHPDTLASMSNLAESYAAAGQTDRALKLFEETLALQKAKLGPDHPDTLACLEGQARCLANSGQVDRARPSSTTSSLRVARPRATATPTRSSPDCSAPNSTWPAAGSTPPLRPIWRSSTSAALGSAPTTE